MYIPTSLKWCAAFLTPHSRGHHSTWKARTFLVGPVYKRNRTVGFDIVFVERAENFESCLDPKDTIISKEMLARPVEIHSWRIPAACWLCVHMTAHGNRLTVSGCTRSNSEDVTHLIDFDVASQTLTFCYQPIAYFLVFLAEREAAHASAC
jgi:hypothetical protein